jgi:hypothetical protein
VGTLPRSPRTPDEEYTLSSTVTVRRVFGRGSPVLDYWLGHSEGFELTSPGGGHRGVVEEVLIDERGYPRALVVRGGVLQREQVVDVDSVEAVVPADGTITLRGERRKRTRPGFTLPRTGRLGGAALAGAAAAAVRIALRAGALLLALVGSAARWSIHRLRRDVPAGARHAGRAGASAVAWARPHAGTLARLTAAAAVTVTLFVFTLVHALAVAVAAYARFVADEWARRRSGSTS